MVLESQDWENISLWEMLQTQQVNNEGCSTDDSDDKVQISRGDNPVDDLLKALNGSSFNISDSPNPECVLVFSKVAGHLFSQ